MKQCPKCRQKFAVADLRFCRFDGSPLISEGTPPDEAATILFSTGYLNNRLTPPEELYRRSESGKLSR
ncbi:MAG TPA: hypothetical protein VM656_16305 [Pyrinomonadaceae bacterium]|nr:hypothetical protein [Pyrinomonadaceae bacterium]